MKTTMRKAGAGAVVIILLFVQVQASDWANYSNYTKATCIAKRNNELWMSDKAGLVMYNLNTGEKTFFTKGPGQLPSLTIERVAVNPQTNDIWIGTYDNGIARYTGSGWQHISFPEPDALLYEMKIAADGAVWSATSRGVYKYVGGQFTAFLTVPANTSPPCWDFDFAPNGKLFCSHTLPFFFDPATQQTQTVISPALAYSQSSVLTIDDHHFVFSGDHGDVAMITDSTETDTIEIGSLALDMQTQNGHLFLLDEATKNLYQRTGSTLTTVDMQAGNGELEAFLTDAAGNIWAGANYNGGNLYIMDNSANVQQIDLHHSNIDDNWVPGIRPGSNGDLLLLESNGIQRFNPSTGQFSNAFTTPPPFPVSDILQANGTYYAATNYNYFYQYDAVNGWVQKGSGILPSAEVDKLTSDNQGNVWLCGPGYVAKYNGTSIGVYDQNNNLHLSNNLYIRDVFCDNYRNEVWAVSYNGLFKISNNTVSYYNDSTPGFLQYYDAAEVVSEDAQHNIWFGMVYGALVKYDGTSFNSILLPNHVGNQFITDISFVGNTMYISDNLNGVWVYENNTWDSLNIDNSAISDNNVTSLITDANGNLWMSHIGYGIDVYNKNGLTVSAITEANTVPVNVYPNPSTGNFTMQLNSDADINVYTIGGRQVLSLRAAKGPTNINLSGNAPGIYFAEVKTQQTRFMAKLVLQ